MPSSIKSNKFNDSYGKIKQESSGDEYGLNKVKGSTKDQLPNLKQGQSPVQNTKAINLPTSNNSVPVNKKIKPSKDKYDEDFEESDNYKNSSNNNSKQPKPVIFHKSEIVPSESKNKPIEETDKAKLKPGKIKIDDIKRLDSEKDKSSDFDDYNDTFIYELKIKLKISWTSYTQYVTSIIRILITLFRFISWSK